MAYAIVSCAILTFSLTISAAADPGKINFFYEFRPDATYKMTTEMENDIDIDFKGEELDEEQMRFMQLGSMKQIVGIDTEQKFGAPDENGHLPFDVNVKDYRTKMLMGGMEIPMSPETLKMMKETMMKMKWNGKMTRRGKIVDLFVSGESIPGLSQEDLKKIFSYFPEFPEKELSIGDDFTYSLSQPFEFGRGEEAIKAEIDVIRHFHLKEIREGAAHFDVKTEFSLAAVSAKSENMNVVGSGKGYAVFDIERHFFMSMNQDGDFTLTADKPSGKKGEKGKEKPVQMIMNVKSKTEMTMTISE